MSNNNNFSSPGCSGGGLNSSFSSQSSQTSQNHQELNNKHVSFAQKTTMLNFIIEHKQLAYRDNADNAPWNELATILNQIPGAVKSSDGWEKAWKLWVSNIEKKRNDLSITLLDVQLQTFIDEIEKEEKVIAALKDFVENDDSLLKTEQLKLIISTPEFSNDNSLIISIGDLEKLELKEVKLKSNLEIGVNELGKMIDMKIEIEEKINSINNNLNINENQAIILMTEKRNILADIRNRFRTFYYS